MAANYSLQLSSVLPYDATYDERFDFALRFAQAWEPDGEFYDVIQNGDELTLLEFTTGPDAVGTVIESARVEIGQPDLSMHDQDFMETWKECGGPISNDLWATLAATIFVPNEELWPSRKKFGEFNAMPLLDAAMMLTELRDDASGDERDALEAIRKDFFRAYELNVHITITP